MHTGTLNCSSETRLSGEFSVLGHDALKYALAFSSYIPLTICDFGSEVVVLFCSTFVLI